jgi:hypothetical protein
MKHVVLAALALAPGLAGAQAPPAHPPFSLHPENPHYFLFRGKPAVIITSGEHYGALLNLDFDYRAYFEALEADRMNSTRTFSGAYVETSGNFNIAGNTLDPAPGRFICPWARSDTPGYADGGSKFDLSRFDDAYFARLRDFAAEASRRGIIIEMNLFCPFYDESQWKVSPMNAANNVNGVGSVPRTDVYTLDRNGGLLAVQEAMTRRIVRELRGFDNVYYEIANEPYFGGITLEWQHRIADVIAAEEKALGVKHLISRNVANGSAKVEDPHPEISILNFHYATPPDAVAANYHLGRAIGDNETGFRGTGDAAYRTEAWDFIVAGGALYNNLDYSFTAAHPRGTWTDLPASQPGGGGPTLRRQLQVLRDFIDGFDFIRMRPENGVIRGGVPPGGTARALVEAGRAYAIYVRQTGSTGPFSVRWTGEVEPRFTEEYAFHTLSNDGVRLWVDGKKIIDDWTDHAEKEDTGKIALEAGRSTPIRLEYFYNGGQGAMKLRWSSKSQKKEPIPAERLRLPGGAGRGLKGEYFRGRDLKEPWRSRDDASIDFAWGTKPPFPIESAAGATRLEIELPAGAYAAEWVDTRTGAVARSESFDHPGGPRRLDAPAYEEDIALRVKARR